MKKLLLLMTFSGAVFGMRAQCSPDLTAPVYPAGSGVATISIPAGGSSVNWNPYTYNFTDPIPAGSYITGVDLTFAGRDQGWGGTGDWANLYVSGTWIGNAQFLPSTQTFNLTYSFDVPAYVYGGNNTLQMHFTGYPGWEGFWEGGTLKIHYSGLPVLTSECSLASITAPATTDNCAGSITGTTSTTFPITAQGTTYVNWNFSDGSNSIIVAQKVVIDDVTAPVANSSSLADVTNQCSVASITAPTASDVCAGSITGTTTTTFPITATGTTMVTWTFNDGNGNTSTQTQNVIINDITAPAYPLGVAGTSVINIPAGGSSINWTPYTYNFMDPIPAGAYVTGVDLTFAGRDQGWGGTGDWANLYVSGTWIGNAQFMPFTQTFNINYNAPVTGYVYGGSNNLQMTFTGYPGWEGFWEGGTLTIHYSVLPAVTGECSVTAVTAPTTTDNCAGTVTGTTTAVFPITAPGTSFINWTFNDSNGNSTSVAQQIIIDDVTAPVANASSLTDVTNECSVASITAPAATDNCAGTITGTTTAVFPITVQGTTTVTWTFDDGNGNTSTQSQNVVIADVTSPLADAASLSDVTNECSVASITAPAATDNCAGTITGTTTAVFPITVQGTTTVTWTFNDGNGNTSTQSQNVVIADVTSPVADAASLSDVTNECSVASITAPTATDNCAGTIAGTTATIFPITSQGSTTVTWTFNDGNGNTSTQSQNVVIADVTSPVADAASLSDVTNECSVASIIAPTATDNCSGIITGTTATIFPITMQGTTIVTWTFNDGNGNSSIQSQNVVILDITAPVISGCPSNITINANNTACTGIASWIDPAATDNCTAIPSMSASHNTAFVFPLGTTTVTYTVSDDNGNASACSFDVTVVNDLNATVTFANVLCNGGATGAVDLTVTGGAIPYTFDWNSGAYTSEDLNGIAAGSYTGVLTDANGCIDGGTIVITEPSALSSSAITTDEMIANDGSIDLTVAGGIAPYTYDWNGPAGFTSLLEDPSGLTAGTYTVAYTDVNGCMNTMNVIVGTQVGITETGIFSFSVYPNPSNGIINLTLSNLYDNEANVEIWNVLGEIVYSTSVNTASSQLNIEAIGSGTYFIRVQTGSKIETSKIIIQK
jgi:hypothetical protein